MSAAPPNSPRLPITPQSHNAQQAVGDNGEPESASPTSTMAHIPKWFVASNIPEGRRRGPTGFMAARARNEGDAGDPRHWANLTVRAASELDRGDRKEMIKCASHEAAGSHCIAKRVYYRPARVFLCGATYVAVAGTQSRWRRACVRSNGQRAHRLRLHGGERGRHDHGRADARYLLFILE